MPFLALVFTCQEKSSMREVEGVTYHKRWSPVRFNCICSKLTHQCWRHFVTATGSRCDPTFSVSYSVTVRPGALGRRLSNHNVFLKTRFLSFSSDAPIKFSFNYTSVVNFKTVWTCLTSQETVLKFINVVGPFAKEIENLCVQKPFWLDNLLPSVPVRVVAL